ncbi:MAG: lipase family protein [Acidimicrobiales bacterium]
MPDPLGHPIAMAVLADKHRAAWCQGGAKVQFQPGYISEHIALAITGAPGAVAYLATRFLRLPGPRCC